jgi:hypothetical protein
MIAIIELIERPIIVDHHGQPQFARWLYLALGYRLRTAVRTMCESLERRFAAFAGVPYHDRLLVQQWEQLLATEPFLSHDRNLSGSQSLSVTSKIHVPDRSDDQYRPIGGYELRLRGRTWN